MSQSGDVGRRPQLTTIGNVKRANQKAKAKKLKSKPKKWSEKQLMRIAEKAGLDSQKTQVRYHQRLTVNLNPNEGIYNNAQYSIQPSGMDSLLPNYSALTNSDRQIYIDTISIYIVYNENDLQINSDSSEFIRHFVVYKDDETDATQNEITTMFKSTGAGINVMEESLNAVVPQSGHIYKNKDSGWISYDARRKDSLSTGVTPTDIPNFVYPYKRFRKTLRLKKVFQINDNGTLIDWKIPTVALFFTGSSQESPDVHCYYHMYYKVVA